MASIRKLKKDINNVLGEILDKVEAWELEHPKKDHKDAEKITDDTIALFDDLVEKVNDQTMENRSKHLKNVREELIKKADKLTERTKEL